MQPVMEEVVQWAATMADKSREMEKKVEAEDMVRKISSDLCREILELGESDNIIEMCKRKKKAKIKSSSRVSVEMPVLGPVDTAEFMNAAIQGNLKVVEKYLADGGKPDVHDEFNRTALHRASIEGHCAVVQKLLEKGANVHFKDRLDSMAIHWACRGGSLEVVKALKSHGADLNVRDKLYSTPLHVATRTGHADIVDYLLSCGVKINSRDREGDTALHDAVRLNRYKIVKLLIVAGADTKIKNHEGVTAVEQVKEWQFDTVETLERLERLKEAGLLPPENTAEDDYSAL